MEPTQRINPSIPAVYVCMHSFRTQKKKKKKKKKMKARDVGAPVTWLCLGIRICSYTMYLVFFTFVNLDLWFFATLGSADFCWTKLSHPNLKKKTNIHAFWSWLRYLETHHVVVGPRGPSFCGTLYCTAVQTSKWKVGSVQIVLRGTFVGHSEYGL